MLAKRDTLTRGKKKIGVLAEAAHTPPQGTKPDTTKSKWVGRLRKPTEKMLWSRALEDGVLDADEKRALVTSYVLRNARHLPLLGLGDAKGPEAAIDGILEKADEAAGRDSDNFTRHMGGLYVEGALLLPLLLLLLVPVLPLLLPLRRPHHPAAAAPAAERLLRPPAPPLLLHD